MEYLPKIVLSDKAWRTMTWFTKNLNTEIGAVGTVKIRQEDGDKYFYVENLYFPKQNVSGATVHFTAEMWGDLIREVPLEELGKIGFYWHRHPAGSAAHSHTDEEDTFETFMSKDAKPQRPYFLFMQTAHNTTTGEIVTESRIDITKPIRATILDKNIKVEYEVSDKIRELEKALAEEKEETKTFCNEIKERVITKPKVTTTNTWGKNSYARTSSVKKDKFAIDEGVKQLFSNVEKDSKRFYADNDNLENFATSEEEKASIEFVNGEVRVVAGLYFDRVMMSALEKGGKLSSVAKKFSTSKMLTTSGRESSMVLYKLQPHKKGFIELTDKVKELFSAYNQFLINREKKQSKAETQKTNQLSAAEMNAKEQSGHVYHMDDEGAIYDILNDLEKGFDVVWTAQETGTVKGSVYDFDTTTNTQRWIGSISLMDDSSKADFYGKDLVDIIIGLEAALEDRLLSDLEYEQEDRLITEEELYDELEIPEVIPVPALPDRTGGKQK